MGSVKRQFCTFLRNSIAHKSLLVKHSCSSSIYLSRKTFHCISNLSSHNLCLKLSNCRSSISKRNYKTEHDWLGSRNKEFEARFTDMTLMRQKQAHNTLLIELASKDDINQAAKMCKDFGEVHMFIPYVCGYGNTYLLSEFADERSTHKMLKECRFKNSSDTFPLYSRHIRYERRKNLKKVPNFIDDKKYDLKSKTQSIDSTCQVSQLMKQNYENTKLTEASVRLRFFFASILEDAVSGMFPYCSVLPFGSSVNGCGVEGCDLDLMIQICPEHLSGRSDLTFFTRPNSDPRIIQQRTLNFMYEIIRNIIPGINHVNKIKHARVPILKFSHSILEFDCDISINNMTAVFMSEVLYFLGSLDYRVSPLIFAVKKWAKEANITYASPGSWITNFSLTLLVIFFLQTRKNPILPPLVKAMAIESYSDTFACAGIKYIESSTKWRSLSKENTDSLATLLKEFLHFTSTYPFDKMHISILHGTAAPREDSSAIWIQYPLEEDKNVAKNVSEMELKQLQRLAGMSAAYLEGSLQGRNKHSAELISFLGIQQLKTERSIEVNTFYEDVETKEDARLA